ncbi:MAG TPA: Wzz/FepE/Etk N-terminal domain-containing protein [Acidimicrobiia bacterium]
MTWRASGAESTTARQIVDRWWMVAAIALVGAIGGYWLPQLDPPVYQSASTFVIATEDSIEDSGDVAAALGVLRNRQITATFAEILQSETLLDRAAREIGSAGSDFESTGVVLPESNVVSLTVSGSDADAVREVNQIIGAAGSEDLASLYPIYRAILLESAKTPSAPASPVPVRDALFGAAVGAFLGIVLSVVWPVPDRQTPPIMGIETARIQERAEAGGES